MRNVKGITEEKVSARMVRHLKDAGQRVKRSLAEENQQRSCKRNRILSDDSDSN